MFEHSEQASLISKGVIEIRISTHLTRELTGQHGTRGSRRHHKSSQFTTTIKELSQTHHTPSACLPLDTSMAICGWPTHYPLYIREV
jgi:hypothetical protein